MSRLLVINACCECPHSRTTSACFHPNTPGRTDEYGKPPMNDGSGHTHRCSRSLPPATGRGWPEHQHPPDWCPLPKEAPSDTLRAAASAVIAYLLNTSRYRTEEERFALHFKWRDGDKGTEGRDLFVRLRDALRGAS